MTPEEGGECWSGKMFFKAWTAGSALFPCSRRHSQKFQTGLIVAAFPSQIVDKRQRKTVSWQRVVQVRDGFDFPLLSDPDGAVATQYGVRRRFTALSPTKRATFVIGSDLKIVAVIQSEVRMNVHADRALEAVAKLSAH